MAVIKNFFKHFPFIASILLFFLSFYINRLFMSNFDENDHLAVAFFMNSDRLLYKDIFSHHFPFPYYWTYIFTPLWNQNSPSQTLSIFRLSVLLLYLILFFSVYISYQNPKSRNSFSLFIIILSLVFPLYHGNLVLSETYMAVFVVSLFCLVAPIILR